MTGETRVNVASGWMVALERVVRSRDLEDRLAGRIPDKSWEREREVFGHLGQWFRCLLWPRVASIGERPEDGEGSTRCQDVNTKVATIVVVQPNHVFTLPPP